MDRIEELIKEKGYTKASFAEKMGMKKQNVNAMLKNPTRETYEKIAMALNVPMWQLFASSKEVQDTKNTIYCPHCGKPIEIEVK